MIKNVCLFITGYLAATQLSFDATSIPGVVLGIFGGLLACELATSLEELSRVIRDEEFWRS